VIPVSEHLPEPAKLPEPWLRGPIEGIHPLVMPLFFTFAHVREEVAKHAAGLTPEELWRKPGGAGSVGFHLKHLAGSVDRLTTYLRGDQLSDKQLDVLRDEAEPDRSLPELLQVVEEALRKSEEELRRIHPESLYEPRSIGRRALPTTVLGLIVHIAEHTQRHLGQMITTAKIVGQSG
jgi:uncharacterized damage-inducible protein DinB